LRLAGPVVRRWLARPWDLPFTTFKLLATFRQGGLRAVESSLINRAERRPADFSYAEWHRAFATLSVGDRDDILAAVASMRAPPRLSVLMPIHVASDSWLVRAIGSVRNQLYPHWELCVVADASTNHQARRILDEAVSADPRIKIALHERSGGISARSNTALRLATGDYITVLYPDDELTDHALYMVAAEIRSHPAADVIYTDQDSIDEHGTLSDPFFKPDWNPDLLLSHNYMGHLCAFRRSRVLDGGGFREGFEGSHDHDLILRLTRDGTADTIRHVPFVLYHVRSDSTARDPAARTSAEDATIRALQEHAGARVERAPVPATYRLRWPLPIPRPRVSLVIPTRDARELLETCVESLLAKTSYPDLELLIVDNQSCDPDALAYLDALDRAGRARVLRYDRPFNFSALNNFAVGRTTGEIVGLLNNDIEVIEPGWLEEMVTQALRPQVGAVGARLLYPNQTVQHGGVILGIGGLAGHAHKHASACDEGYFSRAQVVHDVSAVTGACMVLRRSTYLEAGGLDEQLPVAFNDVDFCLRLRRAGLRNLWTPFATLIHHESGSRGPEDTRAKRLRLHRERKLMQARWREELSADPAYNPNLTLESEDFSLAWPPRVRRPWKIS